jgi:hypothetical protein
MQWRSIYALAPAFGEHARRLRIQAPELRWLGHDEATRQLVPTETSPDPWVFSTDLEWLPRQLAW